MIPDLQMVIELQSLDHRIAELRKEIATLPKHIAQIEKQLDQHLRKLEADQAALAANKKERTRLEGSVQVQEQKVSKLRDQMQQAKDNDVYRAFLSEIAFCEKEIRKAEDRILDLMAESESLEQNVKAAEAALKLEKQQVEREKSEARERTAVDERELEKLVAARAAAVEKISRTVHSSYERARRKWNGHAVAEATEGRCGSCQIALRPQFFQDLRRNDQVMLCETCGRILYYHPPVIVEEQAGPMPQVGTAP